MPYVKPKTIGSSAHPSHSSFPQESAVQSSPRPSAHIAKDTLELNKMTDDLPTPRPASTLPHPMSDEDKIKDLEKALQSTSLYPTDTIPQEQTIPPTSSSTSLVSLHAESTYEPSVSETEQSELGTPPTSAGDNTPDLAVGVVGDDGEDPLARYKEGLYAYTVSWLACTLHSSILVARCDESLLDLDIQSN